MKTKNLTCRLCGSSATHSYFSKTLKDGSERNYHQCNDCQLIFLDPLHYVSRTEEKRQYDFHNNSPDAPGYVEFLKTLLDPLCAHIPSGSKGIDFGSGPGPTLNQLMEQRGYSMQIFDPIYAPDPTPLESTYDFVTCTEVIEHLQNPLDAFTLFKRITRPRGITAVMTQIVYPNIDFSTWWYHRDPTHICFYRPETFEWIANHLRFKVNTPRKNVIFLSNEK